MDFDFDANYPKSDDRGRTKKDALELIQICSASYEHLIRDLTKQYVRKHDIKQNIKKLYTFRKRIEYLRSKYVINEELFSNLVVLSEIRNKIHELMFNKNKVFESLSEIKCGDNRINVLPNDCQKYQVTCSYCSLQIFNIIQELSPETIMHLESTEETEFKLIDE